MYTHYAELWSGMGWGCSGLSYLPDVSHSPGLHCHFPQHCSIRFCLVESTHGGPGLAFGSVATGPSPIMPLIYFPASKNKWNFLIYCSHHLPFYALPVDFSIALFFHELQLPWTILVKSFRSAKWRTGQWLPNISLWWLSHCQEPGRGDQKEPASKPWSQASSIITEKNKKQKTCVVWNTSTPTTSAVLCYSSPSKLAHHSPREPSELRAGALALKYFNPLSGRPAFQMQSPRLPVLVFAPIEGIKLLYK